MNDKIKLLYDGYEHEFPLIKGSENELAIDIKTLRQNTGLITLDPGYKNTGSCLSDITFLEGYLWDKGEPKKAFDKAVPQDSSLSPDCIREAPATKNGSVLSGSGTNFFKTSVL